MAATATREVAEPIGRYAVYGELASGGMATVHFARLMGASGFSRTVALKKPHIQFAKDPEFAMMFIDEARLAARIRHPNVVSTLDVIETPSGVALVMDYVHGESVSRLAAAARDRNERVPTAIAAAILIDVLNGLHAAHEATDEKGQPLGIVHRDVSPQNLIVGADGITRIVDFGIAKAAGRLMTTRDGVVKGKYAYMAPERIRGEPVSRVTDVYSASIVLWELLTGAALFRSESVAETVYKCLEADIPRPSSVAPELPPIFDGILLRGLARNPGERYPTARAMAADIEAATRALRSSEIGAWVVRLAGDTLAARAAIIAQMEGGTVDDDELMPTVASGRMAIGAERSMASVVSQASESGLVAERAAPSSIERQRAIRLSLVALAALLCGLFGALLFARSAIVSEPIPPALAPGSPVPVLPTAPSVAASAVLAVPSVVFMAPPNASASGKSAPRPATRGPRSKGTEACRPPYTIDSQGRGIFKLECL